MRVETREGVLVVYDATSPPHVGEGCSGYLAYWLSTPDKTRYVFPAVLHQDGDLGTALLALQRDLRVDLGALADLDDRVDAARSASAEAPNEEIVWEPATLRRAVEIMGFDPGDDPDLPEPDGGQTAMACHDCNMPSPGPPTDCGSPVGLAREGLAVAVVCCPGSDGGGGGGGGGGGSCVCCPVGVASGAEGSDWGPDGMGSVAVACCGPDGACNDGDPCTDNDLCGNPALSCPPSSCCGVPKVCADDGNVCTWDHCVGGVCVNTPRSCDDGFLCTIDGCDPATGCYHTNMNCDDGNVCTWDGCNPLTGGCENPPHCDSDRLCCPVGSSYHCCNAGEAVCCPRDPAYADHCCNSGETCCGGGCCAAGGCEGPCCAGRCCGSGQICCDGVCCGGVCVNASCVNGACVTTPACDDGNPCTNDTCTPGTCGDFTCAHVPNTGPCPDDGNPCTLDVCNSGACTHPAGNKGASCPDDGNVCTIDVCNGGLCTHPPCCDAAACQDDGSGCTDDYCSGGVCVHPLNCGAGETAEAEAQVCCGGTTCCPPLNCCLSGVCCAFPCDACINNGYLSGGTIAVTPDPPVVCVGDTITWTASGATDLGGTKRANCVVENLSGEGVKYDWTLTLPPAYPSPPPLTGTGATVSVVASVAGVYSCSFVAVPQRTKCPPADLQIGPATKNVAFSATLSADPTSIPAKTGWASMPPWDISDITVTWDPPECEGTLKILEPVGDGGYVPPNKGTLARIDATKWRYTAFDEPQTELC